MCVHTRAEQEKMEFAKKTEQMNQCNTVYLTLSIYRNDAHTNIIVIIIIIQNSMNVPSK